MRILCFQFLTSNCHKNSSYLIVLPLHFNRDLAKAEASTLYWEERLRFLLIIQARVLCDQTSSHKCSHHKYVADKICFSAGYTTL
jgi:hypothetical protein